MEEVRQLVQEEGREARNIVAFHVSVDPPGAKVSNRKVVRGSNPAEPQNGKQSAGARVRSASTGRDKRSELQARYWGLLFGNLQRAVGEIYNTVEAHENLSECQEVILVLENYTRDFKSLCEWFRLKWEYDNTPPPQRPLSLAWEVRKTSPAKPEPRKTRSSKSSPSISGKSSPCVSGKNSPCPGKMSPGVSCLKISPNSSGGKVSPRTPSACLSPKQKGDSNAFFNVIVEKIDEGIVLNTEKHLFGESEKKDDIMENNEGNALAADLISISAKNASDCKVKEIFAITSQKKSNNYEGVDKLPKVEIGTAMEFPSLPTPRKAIVMRKISNKTVNQGEESSAKVSDKSNTVIKKSIDVKRKVLPVHVKHTTDILDALENEHLKVMNEKKIDDTEKIIVTSNENSVIENIQMIIAKNLDLSNVNTADMVTVEDIEKNIIDSNEICDLKDTESTSAHIHAIYKNKTEIANADVKTDLERTEKFDSNKNVNLTKPAYSQAASKPKSVTATSLQIKSTLVDSKSGLKNSTCANNLTTKNTSVQNNRVLAKSCSVDVLLTRSKTIADIKQGPCRKAELKTINRNTVKQNPNRSAGSYPFNLTVGRGKIFDGNPSSRVANTINRPDQLKPKSVLTVNNTRPNTLVLKKDVPNTKLNMTPDPNDKKVSQNTTTKHECIPSARLLQPSGFQSLDSMYSSSETIVNSKVELSHVESNESIRTLCPENDSNIYNSSFVGSVEVLNIIDDSGSLDNSGNDGWLTVKSRRLAKNGQTKKSSSHWSNRYNQPSATASLPTLNMIESPKEGISKMSDFAKHDVTSEAKVQTKAVDKKKPEQKQKKEKKVEGKKASSGKPSLDIIRQKSDVTGLKSKNVKDRFKQTSLDVKNSFQNFKSDFIDNKYLEYAKKHGRDTTDYESKSKKFKNRFTKMHFSSEDLSDCKATHDCDSISSLKSKTFPLLKDSSDINEKSKVTLHLSLESLNSDSYTSNSLEHIMSANEKLTASEMSIDRDSLKQNPLHKSSDVYDGDNDEETKDSLADNLDTEANEIEMMTNQIEENERKMDLALDWQSEEDQRKLSEEEELLNQQIQELQQGSDLDIDTETDDTETDGEILCEEDEDTAEETPNSFLQKDATRLKQSRYPSIDKDVSNTNRDLNQFIDKTSTGDDEMSLEDRYEPILSSMSWGERMDVLATLESLVSRHPGRAQQLHAKLSHSMRRRGSLQETLRRYQAKQARAEHHRTALQKERSSKLHQLLARVQDVTAAKIQLIEEKRLRMEQRLQRAAENRDQRLKDIVRKAHDEDEKLREIAFIKQLEAENKRHDFLAQCREQTSRLREVRAYRMKRLEEKAAKEAAVEERRRALETERIIKLDKMRESRRQKEERVGRQQMQREKERAQLAEEKARGRSERLSALLAAQTATAQALRRKIYLKQRETARRHQQTISCIRQKALELSSQRPDHLNASTNTNVHERDSSTKIKSNSDIVNRSKLTSDPSRRHNGMNGSAHPYNSLMPLQEDGDKSVSEETDESRVSASRERYKAQKKKLKKIKQRMITKGQEYESTYQFPSCDAFSAKSKMSRSINQIACIVQRQTLNSNTNGPKNQNIIMKNGLDSKKGSSVHSSLSDLSKNSNSKGEGFAISGGGNLNQLDRFLGELSRIMEKQINPQEKLAWQKLNGFSILNDILSSGINNEKENFTDISSKTLITASNLYKMACQNCHQNCDYVILSNKILQPIDLMLQRLQIRINMRRDLH